MESEIEECRMSKALKTDGFPVSFIKCAAPPLPFATAPTQYADSMDAEAEKQTTVTLPYVRGLSESIKQILKRLQKVDVRFRPETTLWKLLV